MKFCPSCKCEYMDIANKCADCNGILVPHPTSEEGPLSIKRLIDCYHNEFPSIFLPYDGFYEDWDNSEKRLNKMLQDLLVWLKLNESLRCTYTYNINEPGHYVYNSGYHMIEINAKFASDPFQIAAILAHECLHYYMNKNRLDESDSKINELKTDLSTICSGLGILVVNGMQYRHGALSNEKNLKKVIFNAVTESEEKYNSFGYFNPEQYCEYFNHYLRLKGFSEAEILGYIHPQARIFLPRIFSKRKGLRKSKIIEKEEQVWYRNRIIHIILSIIAAIILIYYYFF